MNNFSYFVSMLPNSKPVLRTIYLISGLGYALLFFTFLQIIRTVFRLVSLGPFNELYVLSADELYYSNFIFAGLAYLIGQDYVLRLWFNHPRRFKKRFRTTTRISVHIDSQYLLFHFLMWLGKFSMIYMVYFMMYGGYEEGLMEVLNNYGTYFVILIVTFFFISWNTIRRKYRKKSFKWQVLSLLMLFIFSFSCANIHFVNDEVLNQQVAQKNPFNNGFEFPVVQAPCENYSTFAPTLAWKDTANNGWFIFDGTIQGPIVEPENTNQVVDRMVGKNNFDYLTSSVSFDRRTLMVEINKFMRDFRARDIVFLEVGVVVKENDEQNRFRRQYVHISPYDFFTDDQENDLSKPRENEVRIKQQDHDYSVNGIQHTAESLFDFMLQNMRLNDTMIFHYQWDKSALFEDYIQVRHLFNTAHYERLNEIAQMENGVFYAALYEKDQQEIEKRAAYTFVTSPLE